MKIVHKTFERENRIDIAPSKISKEKIHCSKYVAKIVRIFWVVKAQIFYFMAYSELRAKPCRLVYFLIYLSLHDGKIKQAKFL